MGERIYAVAGSFSMRPGTKRGIHVFRYQPEQAVFTFIGDYMTELNIGQQCSHPKNEILYGVHEWKNREGELGGGGRVFAFRIDPETGEPRKINEKDTYASQPSDICIDLSGRYGVVSHHGSDGVITRTRKMEDGRYTAVTECDDSTMTLFRIEEDGSLGEICDVKVHDAQRKQGKIQKLSHLHNCVMSPEGNFFAVCDKGLDRIYTYGIDRERSCLKLLQDIPVEEGSHPRYGVFHPVHSVFYQNNENSAFLNVWTYRGSDGNLKRMQRVPLLFDEQQAVSWKKEGASDLVVTADGKTLYVSVRGLNVISVFGIDEKGMVSLLQTVGCQGENPRGLCLSPDERYLFSMNRDSDRISSFLREQNGKLVPVGRGAACSMPGNLQFVVYS